MTVIASLDEALPAGPDWVGRKFADLDRQLRELQAALARSGSVRTGTGSPEGALVASVGAVYLQTDGTPGNVLWVKETGDETSTGWVAK